MHLGAGAWRPALPPCRQDGPREDSALGGSQRPSWVLPTSCSILLTPELSGGVSGLYLTAQPSRGCTGQPGGRDLAGHRPPGQGYSESLCPGVIHGPGTPGL